MNQTTASGIRAPGPSWLPPPNSCVPWAGYLSSMNVFLDLYKGGPSILYLLGLL